MADRTSGHSCQAHKAILRGLPPTDCAVCSRACIRSCVLGIGSILVARWSRHHFANRRAPRPLRCLRLIEICPLWRWVLVVIVDEALSLRVLGLELFEAICVFELVLLAGVVLLLEAAGPDRANTEKNGGHFGRSCGDGVTYIEPLSI